MSATSVRKLFSVQIFLKKDQEVVFAEFVSGLIFNGRLQSPDAPEASAVKYFQTTETAKNPSSGLSATFSTCEGKKAPRLS